jgi:hypothetical protein
MVLRAHHLLGKNGDVFGVPRYGRPLGHAPGQTYTVHHPAHVFRMVEIIQLDTGLGAWIGAHE